MHSRLEGEKCIAFVHHLEGASESILGQIPNLEDFQFGRDIAQVEFIDNDVVDDNGGFGIGSVESIGEELLGSGKESGIGR